MITETAIVWTCVRRVGQKSRVLNSQLSLRGGRRKMLLSRRILPMPASIVALAVAATAVLCSSMRPM